MHVWVVSAESLLRLSVTNKSGVRVYFPYELTGPTTVTRTAMLTVRQTVGRPSKFLGHLRDPKRDETVLEQIIKRIRRPHISRRYRRGGSASVRGMNPEAYEVFLEKAGEPPVASGS